METKTDMPAFLDSNAVCAWKGFKSADEKYRALVSASAVEGWELTEDLSHYFFPAGLSKMESEVFEIEASEIPALFWAHSRYENVIGMPTTPFGQFADQERIDHKAFYRHGRAGLSISLSVS